MAGSFQADQSSGVEPSGGQTDRRAQQPEPEFVRPMAVGDVDAVVDIHLAALPGYFLTSLGPKFLALYYAEVVRSKRGISLVFVRDGRVRAFVAGEFSPGAFYRELFLRRWYAFGFYALKAVLTRPTMLRRITRQVSLRLGAPRRGDYSRLASLAVAPEEQGRECGRALVTAFIEHVRKRGGKTIVLEARKENPSIVQFYMRMGFQPARESGQANSSETVELHCTSVMKEPGDDPGDDQ